MTISSSLSNALSGLNAASRAAAVVSSNIANAQTPGYGVRQLEVQARSSAAQGQGVQVTGVQRHTDPVLLGERRLAQAESGQQQTHVAFLSSVETGLGTPGDGSSLTDRIAALDAALITAAASPQSDARLQSALIAAKDLTLTLNQASQGVQQARTQADADIANQLRHLTQAMEAVAELNTRIVTLTAQGRDASALMDQRQQLLDSVATIVPLREIQRENGAIAVHTAGGALLVDGGSIAKLGFAQTRTITAGMTVENGPLSGLTLNGRAISTAPGGLLDGGTLAAAFQIRDGLGPQTQQRLDGVALDLVERFSGLDPSLAPGSTGLFIDTGNGTTVLEPGLAARIGIHAAADPEQGGALWRLRDGLGAASPGPTGDNGLLAALGTALNARRATSSAAFLPGSRSLATLASDLVSGIATEWLSADSRASHAAARTTTLQSAEATQGVDTDAELSRLLLIEQAFAANARVLQTVDSMIQTLLEI